jgi:N6-L-threonylcarbamoyladenine synthase
MKILAIETSCDETAIAILEAYGNLENLEFKNVYHNINSQIDLHKEYGGVFPTIAKREHSKNLVPVFKKTLEESGMLTEAQQKIDENKIKEILEREPELLKSFLDFIPEIKKPEIDYITVTEGPGLEPALWVGINFAKALSSAWNIPLVPVGHMEGHIYSPLLDSQNKISFPALSLLISGGHTEIVLIKDWLDYEIIGETQDDAVGEAFDKVARMMGLSYPGGPEISKLAKEKRVDNFEKKFHLPKPMINSNNCHFSFSGLKTAVLYGIKDLNLSDEDKKQLAREFEDTVVEILIEKTRKALLQTGAKTLIIGGGVIANTEIRNAFKKICNEMNINLLIPEINLTTDNAIMIAIAGYIKILKKPESVSKRDLKAQGNLRL